MGQHTIVAVAVLVKNLWFKMVTLYRKTTAYCDTYVYPDSVTISNT